MTGKTLPVFEGYLKRANLRNPQGPQTAFAAEQMIDELAYAAGMDPIAFRRQNITDERWLGALNAAAQAANWQPRVSASNLSNANVVTGRGFGFGRHGNSALLGDRRRDRGEQEDGQDRRHSTSTAPWTPASRSTRRWSRTR